MRMQRWGLSLVLCLSVAAIGCGDDDDSGLGGSGGKTGGTGAKTGGTGAKTGGSSGKTGGTGAKTGTGSSGTSGSGDAGSGSGTGITPDQAAAGACDMG